MIPKSMKIKEMKKILLIWLFTTLLTVCFGQTMNEMVVIKQAELRRDQLIDQKHKDMSGRICAGILIMSDLTDLAFDSNVGVVGLEYQLGRYMVYVSEGERHFYIYKSGFRALKILLSDYGISHLPIIKPN